MVSNRKQFFDLDTAIALWRRRYEHDRSFLPEDIRELEQHVRDHVAALVEEGQSEKAAFLNVMREIGEHEAVRAAYREVRWGKLRRHHQVKDEWIWRTAMLKNYFKIAYRTLLRQRGFAFINIFGLAVGLAAGLLIFLYVQDERSYDAFHDESDRTYRVLREFAIPDLNTTIAQTPPALAPALEQEVPAVEVAVRVNSDAPRVQHGAHRRVEQDFLWADEGFFDMFSFPIVRGTAALDRPGTVVLTEAKAAEYFPDESPIGQTLLINDEELEVTGLLGEVPSNSNSHLQFDFVASLQTRSLEPNWWFNNFRTYVLLGEGHTAQKVGVQVDEVVQTHTGAEVTPEGQTIREFIPHLQPLTGIHLGQGVSVEIGSQGNLLYVRLFTALAGFILLLACINFMNLATARSAKRAREVGMRKALGARRTQLAFQFLGESFLVTGLAFVLALVLCRLALPFLNQLAGKTLGFGALYDGFQVVSVIGLVLVLGLIAGSYPAVVLSGFEPVRVLKGVMRGSRGSGLRKGLVVFQFAISIALIAGTIIIQRQLGFMQSTDLGFEQEDIVLVKQIGYLDDQIETFRQEVERLPGVRQVTSGFSMPGTFFMNSMWRPAEPNAEAQNLNYSFVGFDYIETLGIEMKAGRPFSRDRGTDSSAVLLNEAAVRDFGWTVEEALGKTFKRGDEPTFTVVGVTEDFHYESLHAEVYPLMLFASGRFPRYLAVRLASGDAAGTLDALQQTWERFTDLPFTYAFLADDLAEQYRAEQRLAGVFGTFSGLAILIACLGLFGLAAFAAQQRTKEIGIRKVLGASLANIMMLLSKDFLGLVLLAFIVAAPLAYFGLSAWLSDFAYRIALSPAIFIAAGILTLLVALLTVSYQAIKAALADPVKSLRYE